MAEVKGKFITLAGALMSIYDDALKEANDALFERTGKNWDQLDPEGWYPTDLFDTFMARYAEGSITGQAALVTLGRQVYPTIQRTAGLPPEINTPLALILFEAKGFEMNHRGDDVVPRTFIKQQEGHVVVHAPAPGYNQKLYEGVFLGILDMFGVKTGKVTMTQGAPLFEYEITW